MLIVMYILTIPAIIWLIYFLVYKTICSIKYSNNESVLVEVSDRAHRSIENILEMSKQQVKEVTILKEEYLKGKRKKK